MVTYTIFQAQVMYVILIIALNIQVNVSNKPCLYLFACLHRFMYFFNKNLSIHLINAFSFNCYVCYQMIHKLFWVSA